MNEKNTGKKKQVTKIPVFKNERQFVGVYERTNPYIGVMLKLSNFYYKGNELLSMEITRPITFNINNPPTDKRIFMHTHILFYFVHLCSQDMGRKPKKKKNSLSQTI